MGKKKTERAIGKKTKKTKDGADRKRNSRLKVFVSYAREDMQLVGSLTTEISRCFNSLQVDFFVDNKIKDGDSWRKEINEHLDSADILLIVSTGQKKESHDFPGFEVGYFTYSMENRPAVRGIQRKIIPLIVGGETPVAIQEIEGVIIQSNEVFKFDASPGDLRQKANFLKRVATNNPFRKLLEQLLGIITAMSRAELTHDQQKNWNKIIDECAERIYLVVFEYLRSRVGEESYPERKLVIRTKPSSSRLTDIEAILATSTIEFVGRSFDVFGLSEQQNKISWSKFVSAINKTSISTLWKDGLNTLIAAALDGHYDDNYYFVSSLQGDESFRLFVSLTRVYYSGEREIHIYIVKIVQPKDYGDAKTTRLAKAVAIGLRFRSLFLEHKSPFSPDQIGFNHGEQLRAKVTELSNELRHVLGESRQARIDDSELLSFIYGENGHEHLDQLVKVWKVAVGDLNGVTRRIVAAKDADACDAMKSQLMTILRNFCNQTEEMNREFTSRALIALDAEINSKLAAPPIVHDVPNNEVAKVAR